MIEASEPHDIRLLSEKQILELIPVSKSTFQRWIDDGKFPAGFKVSKRISLWRSEDVRQWIIKAPELQLERK